MGAKHTKIYVAPMALNLVLFACYKGLIPPGFKILQ
jgi:hypothetical protein